MGRFGAWLTGYFWLACPACGDDFSGRDWNMDQSRHLSSVPGGAFGNGRGICRRCQADGVGDRAWAGSMPISVRLVASRPMTGSAADEIRQSLVAFLPEAACSR
ncbi:hypothetical protein [Mycobacterium sp.]|uniref:hypothetical protein n=1 Tax=Mycobacterium sp. TaxID=1785 RepID=UPI003BAFC396